MIIRPLTPDLWTALADLFGERWCMYWRIGSAYRKQLRESNEVTGCYRPERPIMRCDLKTYATQAPQP